MLTVSVFALIEYRRLVRPSSLLTFYLLAKLGSDLAELLRDTVRSTSDAVDMLKVLQLCSTVVLLVVAEQNKRSMLNVKYRDLPPEAAAGVFSRLLLWWMNPILLTGRCKILHLNDLPALDEEYSSSKLSAQMQATWNERANTATRHELLFVLYRTLRSPFLSATPSRIVLIVFRYAQPLLISTSITYVTEKSLDSGTGGRDGVAIVLATVAIYVGLALATSAYQGHLNSLRLLVRGSLIGVIHSKALTIDSTSGSPDDARAITLMSTDVDSVQSIAGTVHEMWAQGVEVVIGMTLLTMQLGPVSLLLLTSILACSRVSRYVATHLQLRQRAWNAATQRRLALTNTALASINSIKTTGVIDRVIQNIEQARSDEIAASKRVRWVMVWYNASANALGIFSPVVTLILYAIMARVCGSAVLDTRTAFTSVAILGMVTHPANMVMTMVPRIVGAMASFHRIQEYLAEPDMHGQRRKIITHGAPVSSSSLKLRPTPAIVLEDVVVKFAAHASSILARVNFTINRGDIVLCTGITGSGKTTLARVMAGEISPAGGSVSVLSKQIGLCTQQPWVPNCSIRQAICGSSTTGFDQRWYDTVIHVCSLDVDLLTLPSGDETKTGNRGTNISGGQRQRIALARALYSRCEILVLDDVFSALDHDTQSKIASKLFGPRGLIRQLGITLFLISNAAHITALAHRTIVLKNGTIRSQPRAVDGALDNHSPSPPYSAEDLDGRVTDTVQQDKALESRERVIQEAAEDISRRTGDMTVYSHYFNTVGRANIVILLACATLYSLCVSFPQVWLKWWTEDGSAHLWFYIGGYAAFAFVAWLSTSSMLWCTLIRLAPQSGAVLHDRLMHTVFGADMSYLFRTDTGSLLNKFGQDIQIIDKDLPLSPMTILTQITKLAMQAALLFSAQKVLTASLPVCVLIVYVLQKVYLQTSRQLRLLDLESRAAIYSLFLDTTEGLPTIRSFGWQSVFAEQCARCLDDSQRPLYLLLCLQRWLNVVLDLIVAGIAVAFISMAVLWQGSSTGAEIGIALNMVLVANSTLLKLVQAWTSMEISLGAISRLRAVDISTPQEAGPLSEEGALELWPQSGACSLKAVSVEYTSGVLALQDITLEIKAGQKVLVCGRTGSGKSTLLLALLGLLATKNGSIRVDGLDLASVFHKTRRSQCFLTIPQDPFVSPTDSLRSTLDPDERFSDGEIDAVLHKVGLLTVLTSKSSVEPRYTDGSVSLDEPFQGLANLSAGEKQQLSIAKALLASDSIYRQGGKSRKPIVLLDEVTSLLDEESEANVHRLLHESFTERGFTVIMVAHRVAAAARFMRPGIDAVVWLSEGRVEKTCHYDENVFTR